MMVALPVAYALGRLQFRGETAMLFAIITSRSYPPIAIVIPFFSSTRRWACRERCAVWSSSTSP